MKASRVLFVAVFFFIGFFRVDAWSDNCLSLADCEDSGSMKHPLGDPTDVPPEELKPLVGPDDDDIPDQSPENSPYNLPSWFQGLADQFGKGTKGLSPLVLDLDGDGVEVSKLSYWTSGSHTYFDMDNDGFAERTAWAAGGDGMLAIDLNGNGTIDNQGELFGNDATYADGFAKLGAYDSNSDGLITSADAQYGNLRVWVDANSNGVSEGGELKILNELGISQINLMATDLDATPALDQINGNLVSDTSTFVMNGQEHTVSDVVLAVDQVDTRYTGDITFDYHYAEVLELPTLKGFGNLTNLDVAMNTNESLFTLVQNFVADFETSKLGTSNLDTEIQNILFTWAGVENYSLDIIVGSGSGGVSPYPYDVREIAFMQAITGNPYTQESLASLEDAEMNLFHSVYQSLFETLRSQLILQADGEVLFSEVPSYNIATGEFIGGVLSHEAIAGLSTEAASSADPYAYWKDVVELLMAVKEAEYYSSSDIAAVDSAISLSGVTGSWQGMVTDIYDDGYGVPLRTYTLDDFGVAYMQELHLVGTNAGDGISGGSQNDLLEGRAGNDIISGGLGEDRLIGGAGDDRVEGGEGDDTYVYTFGLDTYYEYAGNDETSGASSYDTIEVEGDYTVGDITFHRDTLGNWNTLEIFIQGQKSIILGGYFYNGAPDSKIESIVLDDGSAIDLTLLASDMSGTSDNDDLVGMDYTLLTQDALYGFEGDDTLTGGRGDDYLDGWSGNDTYNFSLGDGVDVIREYAGNDVIQMADDVDKASVKFGRINTDLIIYYGDSDEIVVREHFYEEQYPYPNPGYKVETLLFADGSTIDLTGSLDLSGTAGDDIIYGRTE